MSIIKYQSNPSHDSYGNPTAVCLGPGGMTKTAGYDNFGQEMREFMASIKPREGYAYLLIAALGDQNWGTNRNGDYWPTKGLSNSGSDYGYKTYETYGNWYHHHQNKDPQASFGKVLKSVWNDQMGRIELIVEVDLAKDEKTRTALENNATIETSMGCFKKGVGILMADMVNTPIEQVQIGDEVVGHDGKLHAVNNINNYLHSGDMHKIIATSKEEIICTPEHPFYAVCKDSLKPRERPSKERAEWVPAKKLKRNDYLMLPIITEVREQEYVDKYFAKIAGYYLAEGHLIKRGNDNHYIGIHLTCHVDDACPREIDEICSHLKNSPIPHKYIDKRSGKENVINIEIYSKDLAYKLYEVCGSYAKTKYLDRSVYYWSHENIKWFVGAYVDGDGCVCAGKWQKGAIQISTSSDALSYQMSILLAKIGIVASVNTILHKPSKIVRRSTTEYTVYIGKTFTSKLLGYSDKLNNGYVAPVNGHSESWIDEEYMYIRVKESTVIPDQEMQVYNLDVDGSDSFIANLSAVHNSKIKYDICLICHPKWEEFYKIPEEDMVRISKESSLETVIEIGKKHGVDLSYITKMNPDGGPVGIHSNMKKYCEHMKYSRCKILPTGQQVCVANMRPSFFDISFVTVNADKSSFVLAKVAEEIVPAEEFPNEDISEVPEVKPVPPLPESGVPEVKTSAIKSADQIDSPGDGEIKKEVEGGEVIADKYEDIEKYYTDHICPEMYRKEPELPDRTVDDMAGKYSLPEIISSFLAMGMFPHPREFQRIVMIQMGKEDDLKKIDESGDYLRLSDIDPVRYEKDPDEDVIGISPEHVNGDLLSTLKHFFWERSGYRQPMVKRMIIVKHATDMNSYINPYSDMPKQRSMVPGLMASLGTLYALSALESKKKVGDIVEDVTRPEKSNFMIGKLGLAVAAAILVHNIVGGAQKEKYEEAKFDAKMAEFDVNVPKPGPKEIKETAKGAAKETAKKAPFLWKGTKLVGPTLGTYMLGGHIINKAQSGQPINPLEEFVAKHPIYTSIASTALINAPKQTMAVPGKIVKGVAGIFKKAEMGIDMSQINIDELPIEDRDLGGIAVWNLV